MASTESRPRDSNRDTSGRKKGPIMGIPVVSSPSGKTPRALSLDWAPPSGFPSERRTLCTAFDRANSKLARAAICSALREPFDAEATSTSDRPIAPSSDPRRGAKIGPTMGNPSRIDLRV